MREVLAHTGRESDVAASVGVVDTSGRSEENFGSVFGCFGGILVVFEETFGYPTFSSLRCRTSAACPTRTCSSSTTGTRRGTTSGSLSSARGARGCPGRKIGDTARAIRWGGGVLDLNTKLCLSELHAARLLDCAWQHNLPTTLPVGLETGSLPVAPRWPGARCAGIAPAGM